MSVALAAAIALTACGSYHSQYVAQAASPGELVWRFDDRLQVTRDGQLVAEAGRWEGLAPAVACVPRSRAWASAATARHHTGTVTLWTTVVAGLVAAAAGSVVLFSDTGSSGHVIGGLALMSGGLLVAGVGGATGTYLRADATARAIDAVNLYNDQLASGVRCAP